MSVIPKDKRGARAKHWAFTLNNYTDKDVVNIQSSVDSSRADYLVYGKETSSTGTPHLQGHVYFSTQKRLSQILKLLPQAHYSVARNIGRSIEYAKKEGDYREFGTQPNVSQAPGKRNDLESFKSSVRNGMVDFKELRETHSDIMARCHRFALSYVRDHKSLPSIPDLQLLPWQLELLAICDEPCDSRSINFVVDPEGNKGKSYFAAYLELNSKKVVQVMKCGKRDDMAFELDETIAILVIDVSRSMSKYLNYQFLEDVKDGRVFSPKYESYTKRFNSPHVIVMMNEDPDMTQLSEDRMVIKRI